MLLTETDISCGVHQLYKLHDPEGSICQVQSNTAYDEASDEEWPACAFYIFSDTVQSGNGRKLRDYIKQNKLGTVSTSKAKVNPNSKNLIEVFVWRVNDAAVAKWKPSK